jgi:hypothetical protein
MTATKFVVIAMVALAASVTISRAAEPPGAFSDEASRQADIYNSAGQKMPEGYVVGRSLLNYAFSLSPAFRPALAALGEHDRWLDIGAGEAQAVLDYRMSKYEALLKLWKRGNGKAAVVAMSIEDRRTRRWHESAAGASEQDMRYVFGRRLRDYSTAELGEFQLITDVLGAFSYTRYLSVFMEKALGMLTVNGSLFTVLQDVPSEAGTNRPFYPGAPFLTELLQSDGSPMKVCSWLKSISCVETTCELMANSAPPVETYHMRKVCDGVVVPPLRVIHFSAGTPPERRFQLQGP